MNIDNLNLDTGDLVLFSNKTKNKYSPFYYLSTLIGWGTHSNITHIGMVVKDPDFLENNKKCPKGLYFWESSWEGNNIMDINDDKLKFGVQIVPLVETLNNNKCECDFYVRKLNKQQFNREALKQINDVVYNKPYDIYPKDWIKAFFKKDSVNRINCFWCSALVGYIYTKLGILNINTDWSILTPDNFSLTGENIQFINNYKLLESEQKIVF